MLLRQIFDGHRPFITLNELCARPWLFRFRQVPDFPQILQLPRATHAASAALLPTDGGRSVVADCPRYLLLRPATKCNSLCTCRCKFHKDFTYQSSLFNREVAVSCCSISRNRPVDSCCSGRPAHYAVAVPQRGRGLCGMPRAGTAFIRNGVRFGAVIYRAGCSVPAPSCQP
jgi:hypothetical protein